MIQPTKLGLRAHHQPDKPAQPPRDSISPLLKSPVLVNQRFAKDRYLTLLSNFIPCGLSFNLGFGFSPGSHRQLQKLRNCQRTSMYLRRLFLESRKSVHLYPLCFQSSAARPQAPARNQCNQLSNSISQIRRTGAFRCHRRGQLVKQGAQPQCIQCE